MMAVLVRDGRFQPVHDVAFASPEAANARFIELPGDADPAMLGDRLGSIEAIRVVFPAFSDGRFLSLGARLRRMGFAGRLRAVGPLLADQYPMALRCGFDEIEITDEHAARIPEVQWADAMARLPLNYQDRLRTRAAVRKAA